MSRREQHSPAYPGASHSREAGQDAAQGALADAEPAGDFRAREEGIRHGAQIAGRLAGCKGKRPYYQDVTRYTTGRVRAIMVTARARLVIETVQTTGASEVAAVRS